MHNSATLSRRLGNLDISDGYQGQRFLLGPGTNGSISFSRLYFRLVHATLSLSTRSAMNNQ